MKYLLDTHTLLWTLLETDKIPSHVREVIEDRKNEIYVSTISLWEIALKTAIGKMDFENFDIEKIPNYIEKIGFGVIELSAREAVESARLPAHANHKDPFDRILVWQSITRKMIFISKDRRVEEYARDGLKHLW